MPRIVAFRAATVSDVLTLPGLAHCVSTVTLWQVPFSSPSFCKADGGTEMLTTSPKATALMWQTRSQCLVAWFQSPL